MGGRQRGRGCESKRETLTVRWMKEINMARQSPGDVATREAECKLNYTGRDRQVWICKKHGTLHMGLFVRMCVYEHTHLCDRNRYIEGSKAVNNTIIKSKERRHDIYCTSAHPVRGTSSALAEVSSSFFLLKGILGEFSIIRCDGPRTEDVVWVMKPSEANV